MSLPVPEREPKFETRLFINGEFVGSASGRTFPTVNPATEAEVCRVQEGDRADVDRAVAAARAAVHRRAPWRTMHPTRRGAVLARLADIIERDIAHIASVEVIDNGKPFANAVGDIRDGIGCIRYYAGLTDKIEGKTIPMGDGTLAYTRYEPVGVVGAITPWNFPFMLVAFKLAHALAAGNSLVLKPPEQTPLSSLLLGKMCIEAGIPAGVVNVIAGYGPTAGAAISEHPDINKVTFTGSTEVGRLIQSASGTTNLKRVSLELGGKSPLIVCKSAKLDEAVKLAQGACFVNMGQTCCALTRTFVHESVYDEFVAKSRRLANDSRSKCGDPFKEGVGFGPQIDQTQFDKILEMIAAGQKEGAKLECGGSRMFEKGFYVEPTVFSDVQDGMRIAREEIFGPVQQILKFSTVEEAVDRANHTAYGLAAAVFTNDLNEAAYVSGAFEAGQVWVNTIFPNNYQAPFGGYKMSGIGREFGTDGLLPFLEVKTVIMKVAPPQ